MSRPCVLWHWWAGSVTTNTFVMEHNIPLPPWPPYSSDLVTLSCSHNLNEQWKIAGSVKLRMTEWSGLLLIVHVCSRIITRRRRRKRRGRRKRIRTASCVRVEVTTTWDRFAEKTTQWPGIWFQIEAGFLYDQYDPGTHPVLCIWVPKTYRRNSRGRWHNTDCAITQMLFNHWQYEPNIQMSSCHVKGFAYKEHEVFFFISNNLCAFKVHCEKLP